MVRLVRLGQATLAEAAQRFGVSRPTCFRMTRAFDQGGLHGLIPEPRVVWLSTENIAWGNPQFRFGVLGARNGAGPCEPARVPSKRKDCQSASSRFNGIVAPNFG